jgi:NAD(P)-dependent dehydrogenase (short-subunit alcohol dehydrogenase family)
MRVSQLEGKRTLVTGAASGIGRGIAEYFVERGASVLMVDVNADAVKEAAAALGGSTRAAACDVGESADVRRSVAAAVEAFGGLDVMINNAGIAYHAPVLEFDEDEFDRVVRVNLRGTFLGIKYGGAAIAASGGGAIVNIASVSALRVNGIGAAYSSSKAGVVALTQVAAVDLRPLGVRANVVCPGAIDTPLLRRHWSRVGTTEESIDRRQGRIGAPVDVAAAVGFLASDEASLITGVTLPIDGGRTVMTA